MKKIPTIALATMIVSSLSVMPALAADTFSDDSGAALAACKSAVVSASDISDSGDDSAMMVNWEDGSTAWVSFEAAPEKQNWLRPKILLSLLRKPPALLLAVS